MKRILPLMLFLMLMNGCGGNISDGSYQQITQEAIVLNVWEQNEYDSGHILDTAL